jgi:hypothetical protein
VSRATGSRFWSKCCSLATAISRVRWSESADAIHTTLDSAPGQRNAPVRGRSEADDHRFSWGWVRLVLGLTQMSFSLTAACVLAFCGLGWRVYAAAAVATLAAVVSRVLYAGRPDPGLETSVRSESAGEAKVPESVTLQGDDRNP